MDYFIQTRYALDEYRWHTWRNHPFETPEQARAYLFARKIKLGDDCRIVKRYSVTRYKPVTWDAKGGERNERNG